MFQPTGKRFSLKTRSSKVEPIDNENTSGAGSTESPEKQKYTIKTDENVVENTIHEVENESCEQKGEGYKAAGPTNN